MNCLICKRDKDVMDRTVSLVWTDVRVEITGPLCEPCQLKAPQDIRDTLANPLFRSAMKVLGGSFKRFFTPETPCPTPRKNAPFGSPSHP